MDLNQLETRLHGSLRRFSKGGDNTIDTVFCQRRGLGVSGGKWRSARRINFTPAPFLNRSSVSAFPRPPRAGLSPRMGDLNRRHAALTLDKARRRSKRV